MRQNETQIFDVTVVGGGCAGSVCARYLAEAGFKVAVLESRIQPAWRIGETLSAGARVIFQELKVWEKFKEQGHLESRGVIALWNGRKNERSSILNPHGCDWQLDRRDLEKLLMECAGEAGVTLLQGQSFQDVKNEGRSWQIKASDYEISSKWIIDATGRRSTVARRLGARRIVLDRQVSIYAIAIQGTGALVDTDTRTLIEAQSDGWWYTALIPRNRRTISFQTDSNNINRSKSQDIEWFGSKILEANAISQHLGKHRYILEGRPNVTSSHSGRLDQVYGERWLAIGDAAMSVDPLSGQGILRAMESGKFAAIAVASGDVSASGFNHSIDQLWTDYVAERSEYYGSELRWQDHPFWEAR